MVGAKYDLAEFTLSDYHQAAELREYIDELLETIRRDVKPLFTMDTSEADNIYKIYRLIETLYPIAFAVALLIGALLPGLIILQTAKDASVMRVLGATKLRTRVTLALEQLLLCAVGLALAAALLFALNASAVRDAAFALAAYAALHFAACAVGAALCAVAVTKRNILELLQVKE
jgi:predicted lysophospholipase L1 biosynthesis ABC-type transport system permease subunit